MTCIHALTPDEALGHALELLQHVDPHGAYTPQACAATGRQACTPWEALASLASLLEDAQQENLGRAARLLSVAVRG